MKSRKSIFTRLFVAAVLLSLTGVADIVAPAWISEEGVISVTYRFETGDTNPVPSGAANLIGTPYLLIDKATTASSGWVAEGMDFITRDNGGTWELGEAGFMSLVLPVVGESSGDAYVDFYISTIVAEGLETTPLIEVDGLPDPYRDSAVIEPDPYNMWWWTQQVCTGQVSLAATTDLSLSVTCYDTRSGGEASTIDQIVVYARVVPEPTTMALIGLSGLLALLVRRFWYA